MGLGNHWRSSLELLVHRWRRSTSERLLLKLRSLWRCSLVLLVHAERLLLRNHWRCNLVLLVEGRELSVVVRKVVVVVRHVRTWQTLGVHRLEVESAHDLRILLVGLSELKLLFPYRLLESIA